MTREINQLKIGGVTYQICDSVARKSVAGGFTYNIVEELPEASLETMNQFYLKKNAHSVKNIYDEYLTIESGSGDEKVFSWELIGSTDVDLTQYVKVDHTHTVVTNVSVGDHRFSAEGTNSPSAVTFTGQESKQVLGTNATFKGNKSAVTITNTETKKVLDSGTTATAQASTVTFADSAKKSVLGAGTTFTANDSAVTLSGEEKEKLEVKTIRTVSGTADGISKITCAEGTSIYSMRVDGEVLDFSSVTITSDIFAKAETTTTRVATGALTTSGDGASVVTKSNNAGTASAQTITVGNNDKVMSVTGNGTAAGQAITITPSLSDVVSNVGTAEADGQSISVEAGDAIYAITNIGTGTAAAQTFTGTEVLMNHSVLNTPVTSDQATKLS